MIYIVQSSEYVKIGVAKNIEKRIVSLQTGNQHKLKLIATKETFDDYELEREIHRQYSENRKQGEWFILSERQMVDLIESFKFKQHEEYKISDNFNKLVDYYERSINYTKEKYKIRLEHKIEIETKKIKEFQIKKMREVMSNFISSDFLFPTNCFL